MERKSIFTVDPASPLEDADMFFVGQVRDNLSSTNSVALDVLKAQLGGGGHTVIEYNPADNQVTTELSVDTVGEGTLWDGANLSFTGTPSFVTVVGGELTKVEYVGISAARSSSGTVTVSPMMSSNVSVLSFIPHHISDEQHLKTILTNPSDVDYSYLSFISLGQQITVIGFTTDPENPTGPKTFYNGADTYSPLGNCNFKINTYYNLLLEYGYTVDELSSPEYAATKDMYVCLFTADPLNPGDPSPELIGYIDAEMSRMSLMVIGDPGSTGTAATLEPLDLAIDLSTMRTIAQILPPDTKDGDFLVATVPSTLLGVSLEIGDYLQLYDNKTKGIVIRQDTFLTKKILSATPQPVSLTPGTVTNLVCRGIFNRTQFNAIAGTVTDPVAGNFLIVWEPYTPMELYFWVNNRWMILDKTRSLGVVDEVSDLQSLSANVGDIVALDLGGGKYDFHLFTDGFGWVSGGAVKYLSELSGNATSTHFNKQNLKNFLNDTEITQSSLTEYDDSNSKLIRANTVREYLNTYFNPRTVAYAMYRNRYTIHPHGTFVKPKAFYEGRLSNLTIKSDYIHDSMPSSKSWYIGNPYDFFQIDDHLGKWTLDLEIIGSTLGTSSVYIATTPTPLDIASDLSSPSTKYNTHAMRIYQEDGKLRAAYGAFNSSGVYQTIRESYLSVGAIDDEGVFSLRAITPIRIIHDNGFTLEVPGVTKRFITQAGNPFYEFITRSNIVMFTDNTTTNTAVGIRNFTRTIDLSKDGY